MILYSYNVSPYAAKVRAILRYKGLAFEERFVHPLRRGELQRISRQPAVPVLACGEQVIVDSTRIARWLDERYPARPIFPVDPALRARALLYEEWADEGLSRVIQPVRWLMPRNFDRSLALFRAAYPADARARLEWVALRRFFQIDFRRKYGERFGAPPEATILNRLAEVMDLVDDALAETGWLAGPAPSVADFALYGMVHFLEGLDGWETVKARRRVVRLLRALEEPAPKWEASEEADHDAMADARRHREKKRLPLV